MAVAALAGAKPGERILDLCAAPGGKTTQLAAAMRGEGLLVSNEIHPGRAKILSSNVERMGIPNAVVLNETPRRLAERFPAFFAARDLSFPAVYAILKCQMMHALERRVRCAQGGNCRR